MEILGLLAAFMIRYSWVFFVAAIIAMFAKNSAAAKGNVKGLATWTWISFVACSLLAVVYLGISLLGAGPLQWLLTALWCYFAWKDWQLLQRIK